MNKAVSHEKKITELTEELRHIKQSFLNKIQLDQLYPCGQTFTSPMPAPPSKRQCTLTTRAISGGTARPRHLFARESSLSPGRSPQVTVGLHMLDDLTMIL